MSPSNHPNPDFTAPPVRYEPKRIEEVEEYFDSFKTWIEDLLNFLA